MSMGGVTQDQDKAVGFGPLDPTNHTGYERLLFKIDFVRERL